MKKLIFSIVAIVLIIAVAVCARFYLKRCAEDMLSSVERIAEKPEERRESFDMLFDGFQKKRKTLSFFVHGETLTEVREKMAEISKLYEEGADGESLRDGLIGLAVAVEKMYFSYAISVESVF